MLVEDFNTDFNVQLDHSGFPEANDVLMKELGRILVTNRKDFVDLLNESSVQAHVGMTDAQLIQLFVDNASSNEKLIIGASLLTQMHNSKSGFDGELEISDDGVKTCYAVMGTYFADDDECQSYLGGVGAIRRVFEKGREFIENRSSQSKQEREAIAKQRMMQAAELQRQQQLQDLKRKQEENRKKRNTILIIIGVVALVSVTGYVLYRAAKKK